MSTPGDTLFSPALDDFSDFAPIGAPFPEYSFGGLYALFDGAGKCLYIGQSSSVPSRLRQHKSKKWFPKVCSRRTLRLEDLDQRLVRETVLILALRPSKNRAIKIGLRADGSIYEAQFLRFAKS